MSKKVIGYTTGVFDMFHVGHLHLLKKAKNNCDYLIVGVSSDELVEYYKKKKPIIPFEHRIEIVSSLSIVDEVLVQSHRDKIKSYHDINFDIPEGIKIVVEKQTTIKVSGSDKQLVGMVCSKIKSFRKPEPYKGKGIREKGQYVLKKEGKKK